MSVNSSSATNSSGSNSSACLITSTAFNILRAIAILPICTLVLYVGYQRWRQQHSFQTKSHSDIFTYHMAAMELSWILGTFCYVCGSFALLTEMITVGIYLSSIIFCGGAFFHMLSCVDRYLAVVHPITYRGLKNVRGVRMRNISVGCVWLLCFGFVGLISLYLPNNVPIIPYLSLTIMAITVVSFCNLSILCVLIRPRPGKGGGETVRVDQSKRRAFYTITTILAVLCLWFVGLLVSIALSQSQLLSDSVRCVAFATVSCLNVPSSLVSPLLFLHKAGKLPCCC